MDGSDVVAISEPCSGVPVRAWLRNGSLLTSTFPFGISTLAEMYRLKGKPVVKSG